MESEDTLWGEWDNVWAPFPGRKGRGLLQATFSFSSRLPVLEGHRATLFLGYKLIPLPLHSIRSLHAQYWLCSGGDQLCLPSSLFQCCWAALLVRRDQKTFFTWVMLWLSNFSWVWANWTLGPAKLVIWGFKSSRSAPCRVSWSEHAPNLVLQMSKATGWDYCFNAAALSSV